MFDHVCYLILENNKVTYVENRKGNVNKIKTNAYMRIKSCLITNIKDNFLWHRKLSHISMGILSKLIKNELVKGFPHIDFKKKKLCDAC